MAHVYAATAGTAVPGVTHGDAERGQSAASDEIKAQLSDMSCRIEQVELGMSRHQLNGHEEHASIKSRSDVIELMITRLRG